MVRSGRLEHQAHAIQAMTLTGRLRAIVEDVPKVAATPAAVHLGADTQELAVRFGAHGVWQGLPE